MRQPDSARFFRRTETDWRGISEAVVLWPDGTWTFWREHIEPELWDDFKPMSPAEARAWLLNQGAAADAQDPALFPPLAVRPAVAEGPAPQPAPAAAPAQQEGGADSWPPPKGWHFRPGEAACDGRSFAIEGRLAKLLRRLVDARGTALSVREIANAVSEVSLETRTVRGYVSRLNRVLQASLGLNTGCRPIRCIDGTYLLDLTRCKGPTSPT